MKNSIIISSLLALSLTGCQHQEPESSASSSSSEEVIKSKLTAKTCVGRGYAIANIYTSNIEHSFLFGDADQRHLERYLDVALQDENAESIDESIGRVTCSAKATFTLYQYSYPFEADGNAVISTYEIPVTYTVQRSLTGDNLDIKTAINEQMSNILIVDAMANRKLWNSHDHVQPVGSPMEDAKQNGVEM